MELFWPDALGALVSQVQSFEVAMLLVVRIHFNLANDIVLAWARHAKKNKSLSPHRDRDSFSVVHLSGPSAGGFERAELCNQAFMLAAPGAAALHDGMAAGFLLARGIAAAIAGANFSPVGQL